MSQHPVDRRPGPPRGPVRRLLEVRGVLGGHRVANDHVCLRAADGTALSASWLPGPRRRAAAVLLTHGFAAHRRKPAYARLADSLSLRVPTLSLDLRGHGTSAGTSTFGHLEALDVAAGVDWLRRRGHDEVVVVGVSMGGTAVVHALGAHDVDAAAVVLISAPSRLGRTDAEPLARLDDVWRTGWKRRLLRTVTGVRLIAPVELPPFDHPRDLIGEVEVPLLVVHGEDDHFFPPSDAEELAAAAGGPARTWILPHFGHAEDGLTARFGRCLGRAIEVALLDRRFPPR